MAWKLVKVIGWVEDDVPGTPTHPIAPGGPPPHVEHPIPPTVWPNPPGQGPGNPPGFWGGTPPEWIDNTLPQPQPPGGGGAPPYPSHPIPPTVWPEPPGSGAAPPWAPGHPEHPIPPEVGGGPIMPPGGGGGQPPGFWGGRPPEYIDIGGPAPQPPPGSVMPPIYLPPVIWPDPPEGLPSFDPSQIPGHPDLPDLNHGIWYWVDNGGAMERAFITQVVRASADLPGYEPKLPPEDRQPGEWVVALVNAQRPAWAWLPEDAPAEPNPDDPHVEHHGTKA